MRSALAPLLLLLPIIASAEVKSADLKRCPNGHATLKDVPIHYGLSVMDPKEIERHVKNLDFILGGCEIEPGSPTVLPTCTTCRFRYHSDSATWSRRSSDMRSFRQPFTPLLVSYPVLARPRSIEYEQWLRRDRLVSEEIVYTASKDHPELTQRVNDWFADHRIKPTYTETGRSPHIVREWTAPSISIRFSYEPRELFMWLTHRVEPQRPNQAMQRTPKAF